jgi:hypothetical protein
MASSSSPSPQPNQSAEDRVLAWVEAKGWLPPATSPLHEPTVMLYRHRARQAADLTRAMSVMERVVPGLHVHCDGLSRLNCSDDPDRNQHMTAQHALCAPSMSAWNAEAEDGKLAFTLPTPPLDLPPGYVVQHTDTSYPLTISAPLMDCAMLDDALDHGAPIEAVVLGVGHHVPTLNAGHASAIMSSIWSHPRAEDLLNLPSVHEIIHTCITAAGKDWEKHGRDGDFPLPQPPSSLHDACTVIMTGYAIGFNPVPPIAEYCFAACGMKD